MTGRMTLAEVADLQAAVAEAEALLRENEAERAESRRVRQENRRVRHLGTPALQEAGRALDAEGEALDAEGEALCVGLSDEIARNKALLAGRCAYCRVTLLGADVCGACGAPAGTGATS